MTRRLIVCGVISAWMFLAADAGAQDKKLERLRIGGGSASATQMSMWFAKEGNFYEKHGLNVEAISIPGSSLALQAMLAGELPIIQLGGAASIQANLAGADTVIIATIVKKFLFWIYAVPGSAGWKISRARFSAPPALARFPISPRAFALRPMVSSRTETSPWSKPAVRRRVCRRWLRGRSTPRP